MSNEHFRCDECGEVLDDPVAAPILCNCGGKFYRYVRPAEQEVEA